MKDLTCPYCDHDFNNDDSSNNGDGYEQDQSYEFECPSCEKIFMATIDYSISYSEFETPCLNEGGSHVMETICRYPLVVFGKCQTRCKYCDTKKDIPWQEGHLHGYTKEELLESQNEWNEMRGITASQASGQEKV